MGNNPKFIAGIAKKYTITNNTLFHDCGGGFKGRIIQTKGIAFCNFCGEEFSKKQLKLMKRG